ncbi:MAG: HugZ family protein [Hyphomicrobiales bacterium]
MSRNATENQSPPENPAISARRLIRTGLKGYLATLDEKTGTPYASLITVACDPPGAPVFLISRLARHTRNLEADGRASILFDGTGADGDPLQNGRVTVMGKAAKTTDPVARARFLARHPGAAMYADFADFAFYSLEVAGAHYVGGFGRIHDIPGTELVRDMAGAEAVTAAEEGIVEHMNDDHADAIQLYATQLLGAEPGPWRMSGCDPWGCDLLLDGEALRLDFASRNETPGDIRKSLVALAEEARKKAQSA